MYSVTCFRFWGKFGQAETHNTFEFVTSPAIFLSRMSDPKKRVTDFRLLNDNMVQLEWTEETESSSSFKNIFIAAMTTTHARIKLYTLLNALQKRILYCDTDSVVFTVKPGEDVPPLGDYLGQLTSELPAGEYIKEFVTTGPKAYSYLTSCGSIETKLKGFTLNFKNSQLINFKTMRDNVLFDKAVIKSVDEHKIMRNKITRQIFNVRQEKIYRMVYDKRIIQADMTTLPYGY